jgi:hypothetical protein
MISGEPIPVDKKQTILLQEQLTVFCYGLKNWFRNPRFSANGNQPAVLERQYKTGRQNS